jgi:hypothetical protein
MSETMTYDPGTDTVTTENNLTPDEQNSLEVGTEMEAQQDQLLAGKYTNAEELEKAYIELQTKLGEDGKEENKAEAEQEEVLQEESEESSEDYSEGAQLIVDASEEYWSNDGNLSSETLEKFSGMSSQDLVSAYMEYTKANPQQSEPVADLSERDANSIKNSVGGDAEYNQMTQWAASNLEPNVIEAFDNLLDTGNAAAIQLAVNGIRAQYENATGYEGRMYTGKAPVSSGDVFRSQPELVEAMSDPRYDRDPAYRQDVIEKLDRSDLAF